MFCGSEDSYCSLLDYDMRGLVGGYQLFQEHAAFIFIYPEDRSGVLNVDIHLPE
jgi:hypothetical protein